jgi:glycosyltransferase involved in cell wall biosynthesis
MRNIFVPNRTVVAIGGFGRVGLNDEIRETLEKEGVLDYGNRLENLVNFGTAAYKEAGQIATLSKPEDYEKARGRVEALHTYVAGLQQVGDATIVLALAERLQPRTHSSGEIDEKRMEVAKTAREAYDHIVKLREAMDTQDVAEVKKQLDGWRTKLKTSLDGMNELAKKAGEQAVFELEKPYEWKRLVTRQEHRWSEEMWATKPFAENLWGDNGKNVYDKLDKLRRFEEGLVSLRNYVREKNAGKKERQEPQTSQTTKTQEERAGKFNSVFDRKLWGISNLEEPIDFRKIGYPLLTISDPESSMKFLFNRPTYNHPQYPGLFSFILKGDIGISPLRLWDEDCNGKSANKIISYMMLKIPTIASPIPAYQDVIEDGKNGFLASNKTEWLKALLKLEDPKLRTKIGEAGYRSVVNKFNIKTIGGKWIKLLKTLS